MALGIKTGRTRFSNLEWRPRRHTTNTVKKAYTELNLIYSDRGKIISAMETWALEAVDNEHTFDYKRFYQDQMLRHPRILSRNTEKEACIMRRFPDTEIKTVEDWLARLWILIFKRVVKNVSAQRQMREALLEGDAPLEDYSENSLDV